MTRVLGLGLLLACGSSALAQNAPIAGRPVDYSNIEGKYDIKVSAAPTRVHVEEAVTLRVEIIGTGPKEFEPNRKYLKLFPESFENDFYKQELQTEHQVDRDKNIWLFVYQLKPKHAKVDAIPDLKLVFYDPGTKRFVTRYADAIPLKVTPKPEPPGPEVPISAVPSSFFTLTNTQDLGRAGSSFALSGMQVVWLLILPPLLCVAGAWAWRHWFPDEFERARQYRLGSAARALAALQTSSANAQDAVCRYLQDRLDFPVVDPTPVEVFVFLKRRGIALPLCSQGRSFFQACDAARYSATPATPQLAESARRLIRALEADPCV
jgi:hypothetical protein